MRQVVLLLSFLLSNLVFSQDVIIKKNGDEINAKIIELTSEQVKYKEFDFQEGPTRNINISDVLMIIYENGKREKFTINESSSNKVINGTENNSNSSFNQDKNLSFSLGGGASVGYGIGIEFQYVFTDSRLGMHLGGSYGIGNSEDGTYIGWSAGLLYYLTNSIYIDGQFGVLGTDYDTYYDSDSYLDTKTVFGPSVLAGFEWIFWPNKKVDIGLNFAAGASYSINAYENEISFAYDVGTVFRF